MTNTGNTATNASAFASTFYFFPETQGNAKKIKRACKPTPPDRAKMQCKLEQAQLRTNRRPSANIGFAKAGVSCFYDSEVLNSSFVHLMKFSAENPRYRKPPKRSRKPYLTARFA